MMSPPDLADLLSVDQAIQIIDAIPVTPRMVRLPLRECLGLHLAQEVFADRDQPPFDKSLMDGYALRRADMLTLPATLGVIGEIPAGQAAHLPLQAGQAIAIMTGAPLPPGADAVVPVEDVETTGDTIRVFKDPANRYVATRGADATAGQLILRIGQRLEAPQLAAAAAVGASMLSVFARPQVAILATGDEIVPLDQTPGPSHIRNANTPMLEAMLHRLGCLTVDLGLVPDRPELIRQHLLKGIRFDVLLVTGGMSMGRHDHVPRILRELGVDLKITKLRIKPGKPFVFGSIDRGQLPVDPDREGEAPAEPRLAGRLALPQAPHPMLDDLQETSPTGTCYVFGLPGNPVSAFVCTLRLASRLLTRLAGGTVRERWLAANLSVALPPNGPREFYQPARLEPLAAGFIVHPLEWKGSADLYTLAQANALILRPENQPALPQASLVRVMEL